MAPFGNSLLRDPALAAMGLVPGGARSASPATIQRALRWRTAWIGLAIGIVVLVYLFRDTAGSMVDVWYSSRTFNHAFLVPPICAYLIWICRHRLAAHEPQPNFWGIVFVAVMATGWLIGSIASARVLEQFALIGMIDGLFLAVLGWRVAGAVAFPLFYLLFAVPFGNFLISPLQDLTAVFVVKALRMFGVPVYLEGIFLAIPTARFEVAEACAGVRFLIASIALGALFGFLTFRSHLRFAAFMVLSFIVPIVANWFRALGIVSIAHLTNSEYAVGADHIIYGWVFFSFVTIVLLSIGMMMREKTPSEKTPGPTGPVVPAGLRRTPGFIAGVTVAALLAASAAPAYERLTLPAEPDTGAVKLAVPDIGGGWRPAARTRSKWRPLIPAADGKILRSYMKDGQEVQFFIAYFMLQRQGREIVSSRNSVADGRYWNRAADWSTHVNIDGRPLRVKVTRMLRGDRGRLAMSWYWVGDSFTSNPYISKYLQVKSRLTGGPDAAAIIMVSTTYEQLASEAENRLRNFLGQTGSVREVLERVSQN